MDLERKREYFSEISDALHRHGVTEEPLDWSSPSSVVRGLRALIHAFTEPAIAYDPQMELALKKFVDAAKRDPEFARTVYALARSYGRRLPRGWPPEAKISQISEIAVGRISERDIPHRPPLSRDGVLKWMMVKDVAELTKRAYAVTRAKR